MTAAHCLFIILFCGVLTAFTWGMRGTIVGGERGAMLPGAALGLVLMYAGGSIPLAGTFPVAAAVGAGAMFFGGAQTYGETIALPADPEKNVRRHGRIGVLLKGGLWFAVFGGVFADGLVAMAGRFSLVRVILFVALLAFSMAAGTFLHRILCAKNAKLREVLYFSGSRAESWCGLAFVCIFLILFNALQKQVFPLLLALFGFVFGGVGFLLGDLLRLRVDRWKETRPDSDFLFFIDTWKLMECVFGALGGMGIALGWCVLYRRSVRALTYEILLQSGVWTPLREKAGNILLFVYLAFFIAYLALSVTLKKRRESVQDVMIWPLFCILPIFFGMTGIYSAGRLISFGMLLFVLAEKFTLSGRERYESLFGAGVLQTVLMILTALVFALQLFGIYTFSATQTICLYTVGYMAAALYLTFDPGRLRCLRQKKPNLVEAILSLGGEWTWMLCGGLLAAAALVMSSICFSI